MVFLPLKIKLLIIKISNLFSEPLVQALGEVPYLSKNLKDIDHPCHQ